jgi:hypothetical protein
MSEFGSQRLLTPRKRAHERSFSYGCEFGDLRKTARGASSPAKPALHIPELALVSTCPRYCHAYRAAVEGLLRLGVGAGAGNADSPSTAGMAGARIRR